MKSLRPTYLMLATLFLVLTGAVSAHAQTNISAEDDTWTTGSGTKVDFSNFGNIDLGALLGSPPVSSVVTFTGVPLNSSLGQADTLLARGAVIVSSNRYSATLSLKGLHLSSSPDMQLQNGQVYHVDVTLATQNGNGRLDFSQTSSDGGTYNSNFDVNPIFTFTNTSPGSQPVIVNCTDPNYSCSFPMTGGGNWLFTSQSGFDPMSQGIPTVPSGVQIGSYTTVGRPRYNGIQVGCGGVRSTGYHCNNQDQQDELHGILGQANGHDVKPPNDCAQSSPPPSPSPTPVLKINGASMTRQQNTSSLTLTQDSATAICATAVQ